MSETLWSFIRRAQERFEHAGIAREEAALNAELLAMHALGWDRASLVARWREPTPAGFIERYAPFVERRETREPVAYIVGSREFCGRLFEVTPAVLVPRPETEGLVDAALEIAAPLSPESRVVDVGTGSGCIAVTLALERPSARITAIDISAAALAVAQRNATRWGAVRITFIRASLLEAIAPHGRTKSESVDVIVSNPPYVPLRNGHALQAEVRDFEPQQALFAGDDGLGVIRVLLEQAAEVVRPGGWLLFELGVGQGEQVERLVESAVWHLHETRADLQGIPRVAMLQRR
ncbi:MAG: peptide chain release factor N(5)-glutamine methyltransferase [Luteitalea sp.]|nr:peptide chain release factor N(5)-glutamine methyltransferase [Luteitalea sp.]